MSKVMDRPATSTSPQPERIPPLENGDTLTRDEFERRYSAMPNLKKAELIEGVVYMPSPVSHLRHGKPHYLVIGWLATYSAETPGVDGGDNSSLRLDIDSEPQPDAFLVILPECGGQVKFDDEGYVLGAPELVVEVAASSVSYDLRQKLAVYRKNKVLEYVVWRVDDRQFDWFALNQGRYARQEPDSNGIYRSRVFPGLTLDFEAAIRGDLKRVSDTQRAELQSDAHVEFVRRLRSVHSIKS